MNTGIRYFPDSETVMVGTLGSLGTWSQRRNKSCSAPNNPVIQGQVLPAEVCLLIYLFFSLRTIFRWQIPQPFFRGACICVLRHFSHVQLFATPWTVAHQAPLSMEFSRQEYWSRSQTKISLALFLVHLGHDCFTHN